MIPGFVQEKRVTVSESSQSGGIKPLGICEEEPKLSTSVTKRVENDGVDQTDDIKLNICDNDHDSAHLSMVDHDEIRGMPTTAELNESYVKLESEVDLKADEVVEDMDIRETVSVNDQHVADLSSDASDKPELVVEDSSGGNLTVRQASKSRATAALDPPLSSSTDINQSSLVLSSTMKQTPIKSSILCNDYASIS
ncbi:unnamed protein product, partial [Trichobilharzia regenti]